MKKRVIALSVSLAAVTALSVQLSGVAQTASAASKQPAITAQAPASISKPDFAFLRDYLTRPQKLNDKNVNLNGSINQLKRAEEVKKADKEDRAKELLLKTVDHVNKLADKGKLQPAYAQDYQKAVDNLIKSWSAPVPRANGGYPDKWHNAPIDSIVDDWGMYNRESVSYAAFRVYDSGRYMPYWGGIGNPNQWDDNARRMGIPVDSTPRVGDVAISNAGTWGHAMYVEAVASDGSIYVSDYNQQFDGLYREYWLSADSVRVRNLVFIHFPYPDAN